MKFAWKISSLVPNENGVLVRQAVKVEDGEKCPDGYTFDPFEIRDPVCEEINVGDEVFVPGIDGAVTVTDVQEDGAMVVEPTDAPKKRGRPKAEK